MVKSATMVVLKDIDPISLLTRYYGVEPRKKETVATATTRTKKAIYFLDASKNTQKAWILMFDLHGALPTSTSKKCHNCHHGFKTSPIGLPLRYVIPKTQEEKERISRKFHELNIVSETLEYFETEGIYCSFPCVKKAIQRKRGVKYKNSLGLLSLLYYKYNGRFDLIPSAPDWESLVEYGGHMMIDEYRNSFGALELRELPNVKRPYMFSTSTYLLEKKT